MNEIYSIRPLWVVLISLCAVPLIISTKRPNLRETWTILAGVLKLALVLSMLPDVLSGSSFSFNILTLFPGLPFRLRVDPMGLIFALVASFLWIVTSLYSIGYMRGLKEHSQSRYYAFFAIALSSTMGIAFAANLLTLYIFYEILSLSTFPLVTHHQDQEAKASGRKYLVYLLGTSIGLVLPSMIYLYMRFNGLDFRFGGFVPAGGANLPLNIACLLLVFGFAKVAIMPLHSWLPAAMVAPTPVSALLHAVAVVKAGAFSVVRTILFVFGEGFLEGSWARPTILFFASATVLIGSLVALYQRELKRLLAFSTIAQLSYIVLGAAMLTEHGVKGGILQLAMHAFGKITLFLGAGAIFVATGKKLVDQLEGLGRTMPFTFGAFFVGALSIIGIPPMGGFLAKWELLLGSCQSQYMGIMGVLLASSLLNVAYFIPLVYRAFFPSFPVEGKIREAPLFCLLPMLATALFTILLFFFPYPFAQLISGLWSQLLGG